MDFLVEVPINYVLVYAGKVISCTRIHTPALTVIRTRIYIAHV